MQARMDLRAPAEAAASDMLESVAARLLAQLDALARLLAEAAFARLLAQEALACLLAQEAFARLALVLAAACLLAVVVVAAAVACILAAVSILRRSCLLPLASAAARFLAHWH